MAARQPAERPFIAVNLAAIPRELVESTLFGHERGAFTGALQQRIGKFELASGGTLFLDEIGDLRLELQAKLLRAIQEGEIERVGGAKPIRTTFRLIAATNVDLEKAVKDGTFRGDLFYRLNVIPVRLPPLRERLEDLPELAEFFLQRYNARFHKHDQGHRRLDAAHAESLLVAGQHPRARKPDRARRRHLRRRVDHRRRPAARIPRRRARSSGRRTAACSIARWRRSSATSSSARSSAARWNVTQTARYLGVPLSTLKFKIDRLEIREIARRIKGV